MPEIKPCKKCKGTDILFYDCGYSSFNYGGGKCRTCGFTASEMCGTFPEEEILIKYWNNGQLTHFAVPVALDDEDYCNGCPCIEDGIFVHCQYLKLSHPLGKDRDIESPTFGRITRPDECKEKFDKGKKE